MKFVEKDVLLSGAILESSDWVIYRMLNLSVRVNLEEQQDLQAKGQTHEDRAKEFGNFMKEVYLKHCGGTGLPEDKEKVKISFKGADLVLEEAGEKEFGWYKLNS